MFGYVECIVVDGGCGDLYGFVFGECEVCVVVDFCDG